MTVEVFIKKPEKVEVLQYDGTNYDEVVKFVDIQMHKLKRMVPGDYIIKVDNNIMVQHGKPNFEKQELIGSYIKDVVQGVNPNVHMSLEKLQEYFEVPIVNDKEKDVNKIANNNCGVKKKKKKPIIVETVQNTGDNVSEIHEFMGDKSRPVYTLNGYVYLIDTLEGTMTANVGDYIIKGVKGEFYPCKPDVFEATYDEYNEQQDNNHTSKPSNFSLRDLVMQIAPKHIKYYVKRLEEYGFKLKLINEAEIKEESAYIPFIGLVEKNGHEVCIINQDGCYSMSGARYGFELWMRNKDEHKFDVKSFEAEDNNWREAFNKLVASFPDEILKNTNHHAGLTS